ncbi:4-hydroxythreonine-4-phosphate dehydrogenase PdxA [Pleomorphochaeta sp. DL1XJH-081]|uniref:4-hydroxythreonine-4-phosphate dehydrogenase PdxA n=1 Tax=Pleomorphochaeta sp. DL1XJH-081 TaxID=3409690 RepID=UPI003BB6B5D3
MSRKLVLAIPMGDPAGIGPEIVCKALAHGVHGKSASALVIGDWALFEKTIHDCALGNPFNTIVHTDQDCRQAIASHNESIFYHLPLVDLSQFNYGEIDGMCGRAAYEAIVKAVDLTQSGISDAIVTPPLHKESLRAGGVNSIGHTEILGELTKSGSPVTMFETLGLKIFFMTRHLSLRQACDAVTEDRVFRSIKECYRLTQNSAFDTSLPFVVAALNPHAGEHGLFGDEEQMAIVPAIEHAQEEGMNVVGPVGADSVFHLAKVGKYRAVLSLYHDQGHIAAKTLDFDRTISVTWALPFLRTSVDHGTAFDIAGKGIASEVSMVEAIKVAIKYLSTGDEDS